MRINPLFVFSRLFCATAFCLLAPSVSRATALQSNTPAITALPGTTGMFEEFITNAANVTGEVVTGFTFTLNATAVAASGLSFTGVSMATTPDTYIFQGASADAKNGTAFSPTVFPNQTFTASDATTGTGVTLTSGVNYALVEVAYTVAANATPGVYTITPGITLTGSGSLGIAPAVATFTILVPEPSTWATLAGGGLALGAVALRRRVLR